MNIKILKLGELHTNCYIVSINNKALIIDPASDAGKIIEACSDYEVESILVTHHHFDHILALEELEKYYKLKHNTYNNSSFKYEVLKTPGHTSDSLTFYFPLYSTMFTGDFLFYHTIGRCDLETSSINDMKQSLDFISKYPDETKIYPGHGFPSILGEEKKLFKSYFH